MVKSESMDIYLLVVYWYWQKINIVPAAATSGVIRTSAGLVLVFEVDNIADKCVLAASAALTELHWL